MYKKKIMFAVALLITFVGFSQTSSLPKDHPIAIAAPHLPSIIRHNGVGKKFFGEKYTYNNHESQAKLKLWIRKYPTELDQYKKQISSFLENTNPISLSPGESDLYYDLKSQWLMLTQLPEFYHNKKN